MGEETERLKNLLIDALAALSYADGHMEGCGHKSQYISDERHLLLDELNDLVATDPEATDG